jgi:anaerobic selenocysteine-containing dehydrogenase
MFLVLLSLNPDVHLYAVAMASYVSVQSVTVDRALAVCPLTLTVTAAWFVLRSTVCVSCSFSCGMLVN